ncbi:MAG: phytanoyl-CoA dioxygenase family protein [Actinomycetota bacterium]
MADESIPIEFTPDAIAAASVDAVVPYGDFLSSHEPYSSIIRHNPWLIPPKVDAELEWDRGWYYDTTVARLHPYWSNQSLPSPTRDLPTLRRNLDEWGFCLIADGLSADQCRRIHDRVEAQATAERALGIAYLVQSQQHVWSLVNKGRDFVGLLEHDPTYVQGGPMIERLLDEFLGRGWNHFSLLSNISYPGCHPQAMHQDQTFIAPYNPAEAPVLVNTMYILQDVNEVNGGTLLIPGSHRYNGTNGELYGELPRPINLEAPAGTVLMFDGRLLHGGAVNRSDRFRYVLTNSCVKPWIRQQENFLLTVSPDVLAEASTKLLWRLGFQSQITAGLVEGYGYRGTGREADPNGSLGAVRSLYDAGYRHLGAIDPDEIGTFDVDSLSLAHLQRHSETFRSEDHQRRMTEL